MSCDTRLLKYVIAVEKAIRGLPVDTNLVREATGGLSEVTPQSLRRIGVMRIVARYEGKNFEDVLYTYKAVSFTRPIQRARGVILRVYEDGEIIPLSVPFFKFFNVNEEEETSVNRLMKLRPIEVSMKADGTLIVGFWDPDFRMWRFHTRGNFDIWNPWTKERGTPQKPANPHVQLFLRVAGERVRKLYEDEELRNYTLMFEMVVTREDVLREFSEKFKGFSVGSKMAVRFHPSEADVYFITARDMRTMRLLPYSEAHEKVLPWWKPKVTLYRLNSLPEIQKALERLGKEGFVVMFEDGTLVKVKTPAATALDRLSVAKDKARVLSELVVTEAVDDIIPFLEEEQRRLVAELREAWTTLRPLVEDYERLIEKLIRERGVERASKWLKSNQLSTDIARFVRDRVAWKGWILLSFVRMKPKKREVFLKRLERAKQFL